MSGVGIGVTSPALFFTDLDLLLEQDVAAEPIGAAKNYHRQSEDNEPFEQCR